MIGLLALAAAVSGYGTRLDNDWPPTRYTANATALVHFVSPNDLEPNCQLHPPPGLVTRGCSDGRGLWLPNPCLWPSYDDYAMLTCHEIGHFNGWPGDHPK